MHTNLDTLREEIQSSLAGHGFVVFYGFSRSMDETASVFWDTDRYPNYQEFLKAAKSVGVSLVVYHQQELSSEAIDDAIDQLEASDLNRDDYRLAESRLQEMRRYQGFICVIELSFDYQGRTYIYELRSDWYDEFMEILGETEFGMPEAEAEDDDPMGGYFSKN